MSDQTPPEPSNRFRRNSELSVVIIVGLVSMAALDVFSALGGAIRIVGIGAFNGIRDDHVIEMALLLRGLAALAQIAVFIPLVVLFCVWTYRVAKNARALGANDFDITPGWAVGWHFIPLANLWMPFRAFSEIWRASYSELPESSPGSWRQRRCGTLPIAWWLAWVFGTIVTNASARLSRQSGSLETIGTWMLPFGAILQILAALLCAAIVFRLTRRQIRLHQSLRQSA